MSVAARRAAPEGARLVIILGALSTFGPLSIDMYLPGLPALSRELGAAPSEVQLTLSACLLGLASGQLLAGPLSDAFGRRRPLLVGVAAYALASLLCALAPSVLALVALRFVQGLAGAAGVVIARAIVRDLHSGVAAARYFSTLMLVSGLAPILAPIVGGQVLPFVGWRGVFVVLGIIGALLCLMAALGLPETLPAQQRQGGGLRATGATLRFLLTDRAFLGFAFAGGLASAAMFSYIAGSPFVLQDIYGVSPQTFSLLFGLNALGLMTVGQINGRLVGRVAPRRLLTIGLTTVALGGLALLAFVVTGALAPFGVLASLFVLVASLGLVFPNATTLALTGHPRTAGSASALLGVLQYSIGASAAPLVGIAGATTALPMGIVIATLGVAALTVFLTWGRGDTRSEPAAPTSTSTSEEPRVPVAGTDRRR